MSPGCQTLVNLLLLCSGIDRHFAGCVVLGNIPMWSEKLPFAVSFEDDEEFTIPLSRPTRAWRWYGHLPLTTRIRSNDPKLLVLAKSINKYTAEHRRSPQVEGSGALKVAAMVDCPF